MTKKGRWAIVVLVVILLAVVICLYEVHISYSNLTTNNYTINTNKVNKDVNVVVISDLHDNIFGEYNEKLVNKIEEQSPDVILVVGDMINYNSVDSSIVVNLMKNLTEDSKVFYSLGNSEEDYIKAGTSDFVKELESVGVTFLNKEYKDVKIDDTVVRIGGMYEYAFGLGGENRDPSTDEVYDFLCDFQATDNYKIMMAHRPDSFVFGDACEVWDVDLVVSGHTHGGQVVVPFKGGLYAADQGWFPKYVKGEYDLGRMKIIITSGLGSNKEAVPRFNNVPEVVNLRINHNN